MLVSVIIPCYNQGEFLDAALKSVSNQTVLDWECIIVDDGSTDNTKIISQKWESRDKRFKYFYKKNGGVSSARNFGLDRAKGDYIQFLDCDDVLDHLKFELSLKEFNMPENKGVNIVVSNFKTLSEDGTKILPPFCNIKQDYFNLDSFLYEWNVSFSIQIQCGFFKNSLFENIRFPEKLSAQEDWVVWVKLLKKSNIVKFINRPLAYYRMNSKSRMKTLGIDDNNTKVLEYFKEVLSYEEFYEFSNSLLKRYYNSSEKYKRVLIETKKSNTFQTGLMVKKVLNKIGLLKIGRVIFKEILKLKSE
ncbi:glycosyltransferase [Lutibacter sp. TH_r2]|uniref:glycosyltransferase family 2 protein n=1 Tax=Lutibacter sp. TH_r2 TaxID=3082083 RepID=UPI002953C529|nr:glycosyltransferase [Lutibacter sp. TH_r2]MDV7187444.1 glycosyltransferase [Lutibacter sp. TH_r2]